MKNNFKKDGLNSPLRSNEKLEQLNKNVYKKFTFPYFYFAPSLSWLW